LTVFSVTGLLLAVFCAGIFFAKVWQFESAAKWLIISAACAGFALMGAGRVLQYRHLAGDDISRFVGDEEFLATLRGEVASEPYVREPEQERWWLGERTIFYLDAEAVSVRGGFAEVSGRVRVVVGDGLAGLKRGDRVEAYCVAGRFEEAREEGGFDFREYMSRRNVYVGARVPGSESLTIFEKRGVGFAAGGFWRIIEAAKGYVEAAVLDEAFIVGDDGRGASGLVEALLLGRRGNIDEETYEAFRETGLAHLISLSGLHMGVLSGLVWYGCKFAGIGKRWRAGLVIFFVVVYTALLPARSATIRAAVMCIFFCLSVMLYRRTSAFNTLGLAALVILAVRPMELFGPGFQLSFTAVAGILVFYKPLYGLMMRGVGRMEAGGVLRWVLGVLAELLAVGMAAFIGVGGVLMMHFGSVTPMGPVWTVFVLPMVCAVLGSGLLQVLVHFAFPTVSVLLGYVAVELAGAMGAVVRFINSLGISGMELGEVSFVTVGLWYLASGFAGFSGGMSTRKRAGITCVLVLAVIAAIGLEKYFGKLG
jgi:competence protein ComEC